MFTTERISGDTPEERMNAILDATENGWYLHFSDKVPFDSSRFKPELQDGTDGQVGHFLTAVDIGMHSNDFFGLSAIVGHELIPDTPFTFVQVLTGMAYGKDRRLFKEGTDSAFQQIYDDGFGPWGLRGGNSVEDLRLSYLGWTLGKKIKNGEFKDNASVSKWLKKSIMQ